ncbi:MAG: sugar ABC transporter ATP-binding protein [Fretibacterium sp.]|nr:sugar ABC transporter ATP-binding protein [Fretibacterium sp.]
MKNISKSFFGVKALDDVNFDVRRGEVHVLIGENGAGKSTLMKILSGAYSKDSGQIFWDGQEVEINNPFDAQKMGVSIIYQEFNLIRGMSVSENMYLGREPMGAMGFINAAERDRLTREWLGKMAVEGISPGALVQDLSTAQSQFVSIARALSYGARLIVMDEPTASLTVRETERLFKLVRDLKAHNVSVIFISHHLDEIFEIGDRITVLRDGGYVATLDVDKTCKDELIRLMVGRELSEEFPSRENKPGEVILTVKNLSRRRVLKDISFELRRGEILGVAGLVGSGRTEMVRALYGADACDSGEFTLFGKPLGNLSPHDSIQCGLGLLPEERKLQGIILGMSLRYNITLAKLDKLLKGRFINERKEKMSVLDFINNLNIKTPSPQTLVQNLSGGNQQKAVLAKWLFTDADILIFDEPTRGVDVGAKYDIYKLMNELTAAGKAILMVSSDLPEIIGMSDRVLVMHQGTIAAEFDKAKAPFDQELIMRAAAGEGEAA